MLQNEKQPSIFCLQEPYYSKYGRLTGIPKNYKCFGIKKSRSIIISHDSIDLIFSNALWEFFPEKIWGTKVGDESTKLSGLNPMK